MSVMIIGSGVSGQAVNDYLKRRNIDCFFVNESEFNLLDFNDNTLNSFFEGVDFAVVSPGVSIKTDLVFQIKKRKIALFGEFEFGACKIINDIVAVTGTNGKTTTVNMIHYLLKDYIGGSILGGNVGIPVTRLLDRINENEIVVLECSSFQLETIKKFRPHIAVILNIAKDHLNRHKTMREYIRCKYKITTNQLSSDYLLLNADDEYIRKNPPKTKAQVFYFSIKSKVTGVFVKNNHVYFYDGEKEIRLVSLSKIKLRGEHNISNILASVLAVYLETGNIDLFKNISSFEGSAHRIEFVNRVKEIDFYNDSKATNIASVLVACRSFSNKIHLILGGSDKGYDFDELFKKLPNNVINIAIYGENKHKIAFSAKNFGYENYNICETLEQATKLLFNKARKNEIVLLSPACASFDQFSSYEERGNVFKKIVNSLSEK